jgi:hypothetical protein
MVDEYNTFKEKLTKDQKTILDKILNISLDDCHKLHQGEIDRDRTHTDMVNICAYAFSLSGPLADTGYQFVETEPLFSIRGIKGNKIFDLVLYNKTLKRAILIECKSSISDPRTSVLNPLKDQMKNALTNKKTLEEEVGGEIVDMEYVVCGRGQPIEEVGKAVDIDEPVILWTIDLFTNTLKLYNPSNTKDGSVTGKLVKQSQLHKDSKLKERLYNEVESDGVIEGLKILSTSHICRILSRTLARIIQDFLQDTTASEKKFRLHEMIQCIQKELPKVTVADAQRLAGELNTLAEEIKIIEQDNILPKPNETDPSFKFRIGARSLKSIEREVEEKYIDKKCRDEARKTAITKYSEYASSAPDSIMNVIKKTAEDQSRVDDTKAGSQ